MQRVAALGRVAGTIVTRSPAVAWMADSWPHINITDFRNHDLEMTPYNTTDVEGQGVILLIGQW